MGRPISSLSELEWEAVCKLYNEGKPLSEIGAEYDISAPTISTIAKRSGLTPRQIRTKTALERASFDPEKLVVEDIDGEPRVRDVQLGEALGYADPTDIRNLIKRQTPKLRELGILAYSGLKSGERGRPGDEHWLNLKQINYLITRCGLPRASEWCVQIARVFTAWQTGCLTADNLEVAVELQDGAETVAVAAPALANLTEATLSQLIKEHTGHLATKDQVARLELMVASTMKRKDPSPETKRLHIATVVKYFHGMCPCCGERRVVLSDGSVDGHFDHATDCPGKNGPHETWLICADCNTGFQSRKIDRQGFRQEFDVYQKRRIQMTRQPSLPL